MKSNFFLTVVLFLIALPLNAEVGVLASSCISTKKVKINFDFLPPGELLFPWSKEGFARGSLEIPAHELALIVFDAPKPEKSTSPGWRRELEHVQRFVRLARNRGALIVHDKDLNLGQNYGSHSKLLSEFQKMQANDTQYSTKITLWPDEEFRKEKTRMLMSMAQKKFTTPLTWVPSKLKPSQTKLRLPCRALAGEEAEDDDSLELVQPTDIVVENKQELFHALYQNGIRFVQLVGGDLYNCLLHRKVGFFAFFEEATQKQPYTLIVAKDLTLVSRNARVPENHTLEVLSSYLMIHGALITDSTKIRFE